MNLLKDKTVFVLIDFQEKLIPVINNQKKLIKNVNILVKASEILKIPLIVTEQYPKGLGNTVIQLPNVIEKVHFSCFGSDEFSNKIKEFENIVLFGIEAHICILKTALDAVKSFNVYVVADAISSRTEENKNIAIERMKQSGIFITSTEMILFQLLEKAGTEEFKKISGLVK